MRIEETLEEVSSKETNVPRAEVFSGTLPLTLGNPELARELPWPDETAEVSDLWKRDVSQKNPKSDSWPNTWNKLESFKLGF